MATANVTVSKIGTGFTVDVTDCDLLTDLSIKDFQVFHDGTLVANSNYAKTSSTLLTYTGTALGSTTTVLVRRKTPNSVIQSVSFADRFSSSLWNNELDRIIRWREEADLNGVGDISLDTSFSASNDPYNEAVWGADTVQGATRQAIGDEMEAIRTDFGAADAALDADKAGLDDENVFTVANEVEGILTASNAANSTSKDTGAVVISQGGLGVEKDVYFGADLNVTTNLDVGGTFDVGGNTILGGTLDVTGAATFDSTLGITGALAVTGNTVITTMTSSGAVTLASLSVTGNQTVGGTLGVTGTTTLSSLSVTGNETVGGTLGVTGTTTLGTLNSGTTTASGVLRTTNTSESTSKTTGALRSAGGFGCSKDINCAGISFDNSGSVLRTFTGETAFTLTNAGDATGTIASQECSYTRIGDMLHVIIKFTVGTAFTENDIGGLPFEVDDSNTIGLTHYPIVAFNANGFILAVAVGNNNEIALFDFTAALTAHNPSAAGGQYRLALTYKTT